MKDERDTKKLRYIVRNIFKPLSIDWESGWDIYEQPGAAHRISDQLRTIRTPSTLFNKYNEYCIDLLQSLIYLPLKKSNQRQLTESYLALTTEFSKIEKMISSSSMKLYILKEIINIARKLRQSYEIKESQQNTVLLFKRRLYELLEKKFKFCSTPSLCCETLLCSLFVCTRNIEHMLYEYIQEKASQNEDTYDDLQLSSPSEMYAAIESNLPCTYQYNSRTRIHFFDCCKNKKYMIDHLDPEFIKIINQIKYPLMKAECLYDYFQNRSLFQTKTPANRSTTLNSINFNYSPNQSTTMSESSSDSEHSI